MEDITSFRGMSGEVVRGFLKSSTFLTVVSVVFFWIIFYLILYFVARNISGSLFLLLHLMAASFLVARFAIPASRGELAEGIFNHHIHQGETLAFVLRYFVYTLMWIIPTMLIAYFMLHTNSLLSLFMFGGKSFIGAGFQGVLIVLLMLTLIFAPTLCCILATETTSITEVLSMEPVEWLYHERRYDLGPFYASLIGGMLVFYAKYLVPLIVLSIFAFKISYEAGMAFSLFIYLLPVLVSPILIGRLSGAFVAGEQALEEETKVKSPPIRPHADVKKVNTAPDIAQAKGMNYKKKYENFINQLDKLSLEELKAVIQEVKGLENNVFTLLILSYAYKEINRMPEAIDYARQALMGSLDEGMSYEAVQLFKFFKKDRVQLKLQASQMLLLAPHLSKHKLYMDAAWCYLLAISMAENEEDKLTIQKKFITLANDASQLSHFEVAYNLYNLFIQRYPDSTLVDFAKEAVITAQAKMNKP